MSKTTPAYIDIEPTDLRHRQVIKAALKSQDTQALSDLKGNTHKPIRFVMQWFLHALMHHEHDQSGYVIIYYPPIRQGMARVLSKRTSPPAMEADPFTTIPLDTYDFLL